MAPSTLLSMAQRACIRNISCLQDVGDMDEKLIYPILKKVENPQQLRAIQLASPHVADFSADLWKHFIVRDIPNWEETMIEPKNPRSWWKVYTKLLREERRAKEAQEEQLKATLMGLDRQREENQAVITNKVIPQKIAHRAMTDGIRNPHARGNGWIQKPSLQNSKRGKDIISAIRRQSSSANKNKGLGRMQPASVMLPTPKNQIKKSAGGNDHGSHEAVAACNFQAAGWLGQ